MNYIYFYSLNARETYCKIETLAIQVSKRVKKNKPVTVEYLAGCSSMKKIICSSSRLVCEFEGFIPSKEEKKEASNLIASYIINDFVPFL